MIINPIIPIWLMIIICAILLLLKPKDKFKFIRQIIIVVTLFVINLRIMTISETEQYNIDNNLNILFVIDSSISMLAEDYNGSKTRLSAVESDIEYIVNNFIGARFSVITFDDIAKLALPYTKDTNTTMDAVKTIKVAEELYARGSSLNSPKELMITNLERAKKDTTKKQILFFISDGEITNDESLESYADIKKYIDGGAVLGYGTSTGGKMKALEYAYSNTWSYIKDKSNYPYVEAVSKIDESNLNKIAKDIGIDYIKMDNQSNINSLIKKIKSNLLTDNIETDKKETLYSDTYYIYTGIICILLVIEFINYKRRI